MDGQFMWARPAPLWQFLALLAAGWQLPFIVEPMGGAHEPYSILLTRTDEP